MSERKIVIVSGGADPLHRGHISYIKAAKELGTYLIWILNSDSFLMRRKDYVFMSYVDRRIMLNSIKWIDEVVDCKDEDQTICNTLSYLARISKKPDIFAYGGIEKDIPETKMCKAFDIEMVFDVGGDKCLSSQELVQQACRNAKPKPSAFWRKMAWRFRK